MNRIKIIVSVCKIYEDIAEIFFELFMKNWPDCPYDLIISSDYESEKFPSNCIVFRGESSLPGNIYEISKKYPAEYYICLLGDAFISKEIDTNALNNLFQCLKNNYIEYCKLFTYGFDNAQSEIIRKADLHKPYEVSFIAFIATIGFIQREFVNSISDFEFEHKYLQIAARNTENDYINQNSYAVVTYNVLHIRHGIQKGLWIRETYNDIEQISNLVKTNNRDKLSIIDSIYRRCAIITNQGPFSKTRAFLKKLLALLGNKSRTKC